LQSITHFIPLRLRVAGAYAAFDGVGLCSA
jgi:hypothetical protein